MGMLFGVNVAELSIPKGPPEEFKGTALSFCLDERSSKQTVHRISNHYFISLADNSNQGFCIHTRRKSLEITEQKRHIKGSAYTLGCNIASEFQVSFFRRLLTHYFFIEPKISINSGPCLDDRQVPRDPVSSNQHVANRLERSAVSKRAALSLLPTTSYLPIQTASG